MAIYETIFILDSLIPPKDIETTIQKYSAIITENGGKVRDVDKWGKRRLAYEIKKKQYGFYIAIEFEGPGTLPRLLESDYNYNDKVLRFLTYRYDKNKLKAMELEQESEKIKEDKQETKPATPEPVAEEVVTEQPEEATENKETEEAESASAEDQQVAENANVEEEGEEDKS